MALDWVERMVSDMGVLHIMLPRKALFFYKT
jgi:hypothetical protein